MRDSDVPETCLAEREPVAPELIDLMLAVVAINDWNRFSISSRVQPTLGKPQHS
jgi:hypothetical protein